MKVPDFTARAKEIYGSTNSAVKKALVTFFGMKEHEVLGLVERYITRLVITPRFILLRC
jgi:hypothetical protein